MPDSQRTNHARSISHGALLALAAMCTAQARAEDPWAGPYAGVTAVASRSVISGATTRADGTVGNNSRGESAQNLRDDASGLGVHMGIRKRLESGLIVGLEADLARLGHQARNGNYIDSGVFLGQPSATLQYDAPWLATTRLLAGWPLGDVLIYGTGGLAFSSEKVARTQYQANALTSLTEFRFSETDRQNRIGHALGAGVQWRLGRLWSLRAEYLHTRFRDETFRFADARGGAQGSYTDVQGRLVENGLHMNTVRVGVTYAFGQGR